MILSLGIGLAGRPIAGVTLAAGTTPKVLFGIGTEADGALNTRLSRESPVHMLTSWYNGPGDLAWMGGWQAKLVPDAYAAGYALHLVVFSNSPERSIATPRGLACGRDYPLSPGFLDDMHRLAQTYSGTGPLYVTMFTEFQTYPCIDNQWLGNENYFRALQDQYIAAKNIFHQYAPNSHVSLGWGGWQARFDDPARGGGRSLFPYFADVMNASDFQSTQAMQSDTNVADMQDMIRTLHNYGTGQVMVAHYKPDNGAQATFDADTQAMLTDDYLLRATTNGLFAFSFMDNANLAASEPSYQFVKNAVVRYGASAPVVATAPPPVTVPPLLTPTSTPIPTIPPTKMVTPTSTTTARSSPTAQTAAPAITIANPLTNSTYAGTIIVEARATGVTSVTYRVDEGPVTVMAREAGTGPWRAPLDTTRVANGLHNVTVSGRGTNGTVAEDRAWDIRVANTSPTATALAVPTSCAVGQFQAQYYPNTTLGGKSVATYCEEGINHQWWNGTGPAAGVGPDNFSARWIGRHMFAAGRYTFTVRADDGVRLWVDGTLLIDGWRDQSATAYSATQALSAGAHEVKVEYYQRGGDAIAQVSWRAK